MEDNIMKPIIMLVLNELTLGGTEKMIQMLLKYMKEEDDSFNFCIAFKAQGDRTREKFFRDILGGNKLIPYGSNPEFVEILREVQPAILHFINAGIAEFPLVTGIREIIPNTKLVQTAVFGNTNDQIKMDATIFVSKHVQQITGRGQEENTYVVRNPIENCLNFIGPDLREELEIPTEAFVFGHIGRPDPNTYDDLNLRAYAKIQNDNTWFIILGVDELAKPAMIKHGIKQYRLIPKTIDEERIHAFYRTINCLAHSRKDGECNSAIIMDSLAHYTPVVSTYGYPFNGHVEQIGLAGFVTSHEDVEEYSRAMDHIVNLSQEEMDYFAGQCSIQWNKMGVAHLRAREQLAIYNNLV